MDILNQPKRLILAALILAAVGCGKKVTEDTDDALFMMKKRGASELTAEAWCTMVPNPDGVGQLQFRMVLYDDSTFSSSFYSLNPDGTRGQEYRKTTGKWETVDTKFSLIIDGVPTDYAINHIKRSAAVNPQLILKEKGQSFTHDPCP